MPQRTPAAHVEERVVERLAVEERVVEEQAVAVEERAAAVEERAAAAVGERAAAVALAEERAAAALLLQWVGLRLLLEEPHPPEELQLAPGAAVAEEPGIPRILQSVAVGSTGLAERRSPESTAGRWPAVLPLSREGPAAVGSTGLAERRPAAESTAVLLLLKEGPAAVASTGPAGRRRPESTAGRPAVLLRLQEGPAAARCTWRASGSFKGTTGQPLVADTYMWSCKDLFDKTSAVSRMEALVEEGPR